MQRSRGRTLALASAVFLLAACSSGLSNAEVDACNGISAWYTGGQVPDKFAGAVTTAQAALGDAEGSPLADPLAELARSAEDEQAANAEVFLTTCEGEGWDLPEG